MKSISIKKLVLIISTLVFVSGAYAEEGHHSFGVQAGEVGLSSDVGSIYGNALGSGLFFDYAASDYLEFELSWLNSHHSGSNPTFGNPMSLTQNAYMVALQYDIETYDIFTPYLKGGAEFDNHGQDVINPTTQANTPVNTTGFGIDVGIGSKVDFTKYLMAGLDIMYHSMFTATVIPAGTSTSVNTIESYFTVMLRVGFTFGAPTGYQTGGAKPPGH